MRARDASPDDSRGQNDPARGGTGPSDRGRTSRDRSDPTDPTDRGRNDRGRRAVRPQDIPVAGWWDITWRVFKRLGSDNITLVSGGVAMYLLLSVFPASTAAVSIYGLFATPADVVKHMQVFAGVLPPASGKSSARSCKCWRVTHRVA